MRTIILQRAGWIVTCALALTACSNSHPGPNFTADANDNDAAMPPPANRALITLPSPPVEASSNIPKSTPKPPKPPIAVSSNTPKSTPKPPKPPTVVSSNTPKPKPPVKATNTTPKPPPPPANTTGMRADPDLTFDNLEVVGNGLRGRLAITRIGSQPTANNLLSVFLGLKNKTSAKLSVDVQTIYKDKSGQELNQGSWISIRLQPHESTEYHSTSIDEGADDFLVRVRLVQTSSDQSEGM